jgi:DNA repair exonuclease SbcCD ATPase subunit
MKILSIKANNFRSFEELTWEIPSSGLSLLDGRNLDTGGSNMSGKSSLLDSVFWALYGWLPRWEGPKGGPVDAVIRRGEKSCRVEVQVMVGTDLISVERRRPSSLSLRVNDQEVHGKSDELQKEIERRVMTPARFLASVYASQDRKTSFFTMGDSDRTELLSIVAGLEKLDRALSRAKTERDAIDKDLIALNAKLESQEDRLKEFPSMIEDSAKQLKDLEQEVNQAKLKLDSVTLASAQEILLATNKFNKEKDKAEKEYQDRVSEINDSNKGLVESANQAIDRLAKSYQELRQKLNDIPQPEPHLASAVDIAFRKLEEAKAFNKKVDEIAKKNEKIMDKIERLMDEAEAHSNGSCKACSQPLPEWDRERSAKEKIEQAKALEESIQELPEKMPEDESALRNAEMALAKRKAELDAEPARVRAEVKAIESQLNEAKTSLKSLESQMAQYRAEANHKLNKTKTDLENALNEVKKSNETRTKEAKMAFDSVSTNHQMADKLHRKLLDDLKKQQESVVAMKSEIDTKTKQLNSSLDLIELFGPKGYRSICFDGLVERISARAGQLLSIMTDGLYSTRLEQMGSDSKGNAKMILRPFVTKGGQDVPMDDLSGGARKRVMLAYDVSVSEAAGEGAPLFLDEALDGLDVVGKTEAMALLEEVSRSRPVIVVDHASEMKSAFQNVITVEYKQGLSVLKGE